MGNIKSEYTTTGQKRKQLSLDGTEGGKAYLEGSRSGDPTQTVSSANATKANTADYSYFNSRNRAVGEGQYGGSNPPGGTDATSQLFDPFSLFSTKPTSYISLPGTQLKSGGQMSLLDSLTNYYNQYASGQKPLDTYNGYRVAGLSPLEEQMSNQFQLPDSSTSRSMLEDMVSGKTATPQYLEEAYRLNVEDPMIQNWQEKLMPELKSSFQKKGLLYGSGREENQQDAVSNLTGELTKGRVSLASLMENMTTQNKLAAAPLLASLGQQDIANLIAGMGIGKVGRDVEQASLDTSYQDWLRNQPGTRPMDALLTQILGINTTSPGETLVSPPKGGLCIIVTACTSSDSPEVNITREYRDKHMSPEQLRGYYMIAEKVVPLINKHYFVKKFFKGVVNHLVEYGKYHLYKTDYEPSATSVLVTKTFLILCGLVGKKKRFVRCNGEVM